MQCKCRFMNFIQLNVKLVVKMLWDFVVRFFLSRRNSCVHYTRRFYKENHSKKNAIEIVNAMVPLCNWSVSIWNHATFMLSHLFTTNWMYWKFSRTGHNLINAWCFNKTIINGGWYDGGGGQYSVTNLLIILALISCLNLWLHSFRFYFIWKKKLTLHCLEHSCDFDQSYYYISMHSIHRLYRKLFDWLWTSRLCIDYRLWCIDGFY